MSIQQALLAKARPYMLAEKAKSLVRLELSKGCVPEISGSPVALEPAFAPVGAPAGAVGDGFISSYMDASPSLPEDLVRLQIWISPEQKCDWSRSEAFLKQLSHVRHRVAFEIVGNRDRIAIQVLSHGDDRPIVGAAFLGQFEQCLLKPVPGDILRELPTEAWNEMVFRDFYPPPPYSHLFTQPEELKRSLYATIIAVLAQIDPPAMGLFQVVFQPVSPEHDWHQNVQAMLDLEYNIKLIGGMANVQRFAQQAPSGDLRQMSMDLETKSHSDKPFFAAAMRTAILDGGEMSDAMLAGLSTAAALIQHGGRPLQWLTESQYLQVLRPEQIRGMFVDGLTFRPGFLVNSLELTAMAHVPAAAIAECTKADIGLLETLPGDEGMLCGTPIGHSEIAGVVQPVCVPPVARMRHVHFLGKSGMGKSTVVEEMFLYDIAQGHGAVVIDPHGRLVQRLLQLIPAEHADRVIFLNPADPDFVPCWNPLQCTAAMGPGRLASDIVGAFKSFVTGWGDRLEHLLRQAVFGLVHLPGMTLLDVYNCLRLKSQESQRLRLEVLAALESAVAKSFWREDRDKYSDADYAPPKHKLSKLLTAGTVSLMLSQPDSAFDLNEVMDSGKILLMDLSGLGSEVRDTVGCLMLSLLRLTAGSRDSAAETLRPFHIFCDEAHRFMTDAMEDLIAETRKYNVSLTLAHQYLSQFSRAKVDALSSVGSSIIFNVDTRDAQHMRKDLQGLVDVDDLITLGVGQAIAKIDSRVVRVRTSPPRTDLSESRRQEIIAASRAKYYRPIDEVRETIRTRNHRWLKPICEQADERDVNGFDTGIGRRRAKKGFELPGEPLDKTGFEYDEL